MRLYIAAAVVALLAGGLYAYAQTDHSKMNHGAMEMGEPKGDTGEASNAYRDANAAMHAGMDIEFTGNPDIDFARGMIPHHQGAVAMAEVVLKYGKDPELKKLAEQIIAAQGPEIAFMKAWLEKNAK